MILIAFSLQTTHNISSMDYEWDFSLNTPSDSSSDSSSSSVKSDSEECSTPVTMARVRKVSPPASNRDNEGGGIREKSVSPQASSTGMATRSVTSGTRRRSSAQLPVEASEKRRRVENAENASGGTVQALRVENPTRGAAGGRAEFADSPEEVSFWQDMTDGLLDSFDGVTDMGPESERMHGVPPPVAEPESVWIAKKPEEEDESVLNAKKPDEEDAFDGGDEASFGSGWNGGEYVPDSGRVDIDTLNMIAREITYGCDGAVFEEGEREKLENLTSNSKKYHDRVESVSKRMLDTATTMCGPKIAKLASSVHTSPTGGTVSMLYHMVSGDRSEAKKVIINQIMVQCALTWKLTRKYRDKKAGDHAESTTWDQWLKLLQSKFVQQNVNFNLKKDFFGKGEFHAVLEKAWKEEKLKNKDFGTGRYAAWFDEDMEDKIIDAIDKGRIDLDDREHLQWVVFWLVGSSLLLRGGSEAHDRKWSEFEFDTYTEANKNVEAYVKLTITTGSKFMNATVRGMCCLFD